MLVAELSVAVIVQSAHHDASAGTAGRRRCKCVSKHQPIGRDRIDRRRFCGGVSVAAQRRALVVGDDENDVPLSRSRGAGPNGENDESRQKRKQKSSEHQRFQY